VGGWRRERFCLDWEWGGEEKSAGDFVGGFLDVHTQTRLRKLVEV
jgi:hypothetical protein